MTELWVAGAMVLLTTFTHGAGLMGMTELLGLERDGRHRLGRRHWVHRLFVSFGLVIGLLLLHGVEIWYYAVLFVQLDAVVDMKTAVYFSTTTYSAIGYSDSAIRPEWALVAAVEGINGLLLIGWSTAFLVSTTPRLKSR